MAKFPKQAEATRYIGNLLEGRRVKTESGISEIGGEPWQVFEYNGKYIAIATNGSLWVGLSGGEWRCISDTCTVSSALQAIEFLISD
jgi:hypothetical protein